MRKILVFSLSLFAAMLPAQTVIGGGAGAVQIGSGAGSTPGGTNGMIQYNNAGAFGGYTPLQTLNAIGAAGWSIGSGAPSATCSALVNNGFFYTSNTLTLYQCTNATGSYQWNALGSGATPWQASFTVVGVPASSQLVMLIPSTVAITIPSGCAGSYLGGTIAATSTAAFTIKKLSGGPVGTASTLCTATIATAGTSASFSGSGGSLAPGDYLEIIAPSTADATLANVGGGVYGTR